jgi:ABC-type antimicrobial peptide transport system permease subunit
VGLLHGANRVGIADLAYASLPDYVLSRQEAFEVVYAKPGRKDESDRYLNEAKDAEGKAAFRVTDEAYVRRRTEKALANLPLVVNAIVGSITVVIALVVALLAVIAFHARADEFGLLLAVGRTRRRLVAKLATETAAISAAAGGLGLGLGFGFLAVWRATVLEPKAILIRFVDPYAVSLATALPVVAAAASAVVLALRLARMDPVAVIQRRNA